MGSLAFTAAARALWIVCEDQDDRRRRLFLPGKTNLSVDPSGLAFSIVNGRVEFEPEPVYVSADEALNGDESTSALDEAARFLRDLLKEGPIAQATVLQEARENHVAEKTLRRAKKELRVRSTKAQSTQGGWSWELPQKRR
jgi:putative DNA primase/helicase